jgi:hypothetical protein
VLAVAGSATAQSPPPPAPPAGQAVLEFHVKPNISPQEMLQEANSILARMQASSGMVRRQLEKARTSRDVVKTLCLNDKLSQVDVTARSAQDRVSAMQSAVAQGDIETARHHFGILTAHSQHSQQVTAEANQCVGEEYAFLGATQVTTEIEEALPGGEELTVLSDGTVIVSVPPPPPGVVSPTK